MVSGLLRPPSFVRKSWIVSEPGLYSITVLTRLWARAETKLMSLSFIELLWITLTLSTVIVPSSELLSRYSSVWVSSGSTVPSTISLNGFEQNAPSIMEFSMARSTTSPCLLSTTWGEREEIRTFSALPAPLFSTRNPIVAGMLGSITGMVSGSSAMMLCVTK